LVDVERSAKASVARLRFASSKFVRSKIAPVKSAPVRGLRLQKRLERGVPFETKRLRNRVIKEYRRYKGPVDGTAVLGTPPPPPAAVPSPTQRRERHLPYRSKSGTSKLQLTVGGGTMTLHELRHRQCAPAPTAAANRTLVKVWQITARDATDVVRVGGHSGAATPSPPFRVRSPSARTSTATGSYDAATGCGRYPTASAPSR
jgi:hypothetical protein